jgi:hypothetical protein
MGGSHGLSFTAACVMLRLLTCSGHEAANAASSSRFDQRQVQEHLDLLAAGLEVEANSGYTNLQVCSGTDSVLTVQ